MQKLKKILVLGANGLAGRLIVVEALNKGYTVRAGIRNVNRIDLNVDPRAELVEIEATSYDSIKRAAKDCDIVINAIRAPYDTLSDYLVNMNQNIVKALDQEGVKRLIIIGGAGSLQTSTGKPFVENSNFPAHLYQLGLAQYYLRKYYEEERPQIDWLYLIPPPNFIENGKKTGKFNFLTSELKLPESNHYSISYVDYALAIIHEIEYHNYKRESLLVIGDNFADH